MKNYSPMMMSAVRAMSLRFYASEPITREDERALSFLYYRNRLTRNEVNVMDVDSAREAFLFNVLSGIDYEA
jgi:hypothetical protein